VGRRPDRESRWPNYVPFDPVEPPNGVGLTAEVLRSVANREPNADPALLWERANRIVTSLSFLSGAIESGFVDRIDAYVHAGEYGVRVVLEDQN
jgi:hypothetical protein